MTISVMNTEQQFFDLKEEWEELERYARDLTIFQTWVFQYYTWLIFSERVLLNLLVVRDQAGKMIGCAPLGTQTQKIGPLKFRLLSFCCIKYCDFQNFIVHADYENQVLSLLAGWFGENRKRWDLIRLKQVREDFSITNQNAPFMKILRNKIKVKQQGQAPYIGVQEGWTSFQDALSSKRAKSVRYEVKNLFRQFESEFKGFDQGQELDDALEQMMDLHQKRIRQKFQLGAFSTGQVRAGFRRLVKELEKRRYITIHTIASKEKTIAAIGTFVFNKKILYFQGGFDPEYFRLSPGKVVLARRISEAIENKALEFDFLFGDEDYKFAWSTGQRKIFQLELKTGSAKVFIYKFFQGMQDRFLQSDRMRALYFKFRPNL